MFWVALAGVIVVIAYTSVAAWQAWLTRNQLIIAQGQLDEMQKEQRPWVYAALVAPAGHISLEDGRYFVPLKVSIRNIGHRPAFSVVQKTDATIIKMGTSSRSISNAVCDDYRRQLADSNIGDAIFPGQTITHGGFTHDDYPRVEKARWDSLNDDRLIIIFGCIDYQFPAEPGHHQSRFSFVVGEKKDEGILERIAPLPNDPTTVDIRLLPIEIDNGVPAN